jgi:hypothetical protein
MYINKQKSTQINLKSTGREEKARTHLLHRMRRLQRVKHPLRHGVNKRNVLGHAGSQAVLKGRHQDEDHLHDQGGEEEEGDAQTARLPKRRGKETCSKGYLAQTWGLKMFTRLVCMPNMA